MKILLALFAFAILAFLAFLAFARNALKDRFEKDVSEILKNTAPIEGIYTEKDFENFPQAIREFVKQNGYLGKNKAKCMFIRFNDVDFYPRKKQKLVVNYSQCNIASKITRLAFIDAKLWKLPFCGYDFLDGKNAFMKVVVAKSFNVVDEKSDALAKGNFATYLAEVLFNPSAILNSGVKFKEIDPYAVEAKIEVEGIEVEGVLYFDQKYQIREFVCENRGMLQENGKIADMKWTAKCMDYKKNSQGINFPTKMQAVWNFPKEDFLYFDAKIDSVVFEN